MMLGVTPNLLRRRGFRWRLPQVCCTFLCTLAALSVASVWALAVSGEPCSRSPFQAAAMPARPLAKVIVTDVDGTLMDSSHRLPPANREAIRRCMQRKIPVLLATGKHRGPWVKSLIEDVVDAELPALSDWTFNAPGVFVQGLLVCNEAGEVVHRSLLQSELVHACQTTAKDRGWTLVSYAADDRVFSNRADPQIARLDALGEPPVQVGTLDESTVHKMLFLVDPQDELAVRREAASIIGDKAHITVAIPGMVEVLPPGSSKAEGVSVALQLLGLTAEDALALGDGENDLEMLQMVRAAGGVAVAVSNARPILKEAAEVVVGTNDDAGWAQAVNKFALGEQEVQT